MPTTSWPQHDATLTIAHTWDGEALPAEQQVQLHLKLDDDTLEITVDAPFHDDPPPPGPAGSLDGLWNHEVVELFVAGPPNADGKIPYSEIEISPHGHYLVLRLLGARNRLAGGLPMELATKIENPSEPAARWHGLARLPKAFLPAEPWRVNAYAVHGTGVDRRYLAMIPTEGASPDFHRPDIFQRIDLNSRL